MYNFGADGVDLSPYLFYVTIVNNNGFSSSGSSWDVNTSIYQHSNLIATPDGQSTSNNMNVDDITIGSELSATNGNGHAANVYFQNNQWMDGSGNFRYQTNTGTNHSTGAPPNGTWAVSPCNCPGNGQAGTGGSFKTYD